VVSSSGTFLGENREKTIIICDGRWGWATVAAAMTGGTAVGHGFGVLVVVIEGLVKAVKDGEDSMNPMMVVSDGGDRKR
jgi:hypothetical protein